MRSESRWISKRALLLLHGESIAEFGGTLGLRDEGLLESALARPHNLYAYNPESTFAELAAAYGYGFARNHPFVDGNKRAAFLCLGLFLATNGYSLTATPADATAVMIALAAGTLTETELANWITQNSKAK